jgi:hypothetical protein
VSGIRDQEINAQVFGRNPDVFSFKRLLDVLADQEFARMHGKKWAHPDYPRLILGTAFSSNKPMTVQTWPGQWPDCTAAHARLFILIQSSDRLDRYVEPLPFENGEAL